MLNSLVRDPITNQYTESYFKNFLLNESDEKYKVIKISPAFVKISNTINSTHNATDVQMEKYQKEFYQFLNDKIDFNQDTFTIVPSNYLVALTGGDMLLAVDKKTNINVKEINSFLKEKNSVKYSTDNVLRHVVSDKFRTVDKNNIKKVLAKQTNECNKNKIPLIKEILNDDIIKKLLKVTFKDTMDFYAGLVPDIKDNDAKTKYVDLVSKTVLNIFDTLDIVNDQEDINNKSGSNKEKRTSRFLKRLSSLFRKENLTLPEPKEEVENNESNLEDKFHENQSEETNDFLASIKVDTSKNYTGMSIDEVIEKHKQQMEYKENSNNNKTEFERLN